MGARRLGREPVSVSGGGVVDFLSLAPPAAVAVFPFYLCPDFIHHLVPGLYRSFSARVLFGYLRQLQNALLLQPSRILRSLRSILAGRSRRYPVKGHFASSRIGTALLHQQHPLFRRTSDRRDYAE